jgi:N utilization substance protein B
VADDQRMGERRSAREAALESLYEYEINPISIEEQLQNLATKKRLSTKSAEYAKALIKGVVEKRDEIQRWLRISSYNWDPERMAVIDRLILELGTYELMDQVDVPFKVVINEWIEVAKKYSNGKSPKFINGVLGRIAANLRTEEVANGSKKRIRR